MRLIVRVNYSDDCTYSYYETIPVVYESAEAFIVDFEDAARKALSIKRPAFRVFDLGGQNWDASYFFKGDEFQAPDVLTLDEWYGNLK